jgi:hypothetical protein
LFDKNGEKNGQRIELSGWVTKYFQDEPSSTELTDGKVILSWIEYTENIGWHGCYQILSSNGEPIGSELSVTSGSFEAQTVHALPDGRFIIVWESSYNIFARFFDGNGNPESVGFKVNDANGSQQMGSRVASGFGKIFLGWNSDQENGSNYEVYGKIFPEKPQIHQLKPFVMLSPYPDNTLNENKTVFYWRRASEEQVAFPWEIVYNVVLSKNEDFSQPRVVTVQADTMVEIQNLDWGESYYWKVCAKNIAGDSLWSGNTIQFHVPKKTGIESSGQKLPNQYALHQNYPNPFNPETSIQFALPENGFVAISVYDVNGRLVRVLLSESRNAGSYSVKWDGKNQAVNAVPSGIYVCRMEVRSADGRRFTQSVKMGLVR